MPNSSADYKFVIYPLQSGYCKLPKFRVKLNNFNYRTFRLEDGQREKVGGQSSGGQAEKSLSGGEEQQVTSENIETAGLDFIVQSMLPAQIFIMPQTTNVAASS